MAEQICWNGIVNIEFLQEHMCVTDNVTALNVPPNYHGQNSVHKMKTIKSTFSRVIITTVLQNVKFINFQNELNCKDSLWSIEIAILNKAFSSELLMI